MDAPEFKRRAVEYGRAYEIFVKRGVLACLLQTGLIRHDDPRWAAWRNTSLGQVYSAVLKQLAFVDEFQKRVCMGFLRHLAATAYGNGYTAMREYLSRVPGQQKRLDLSVVALWCPLQLPGPLPPDAVAESKQATAREIHALLGLGGEPDPALVGTGNPGNADFLLWLVTGRGVNHLLAQEYSFNAPPGLDDFYAEPGHLTEFLRHARLMGSRGVFSMISAEVDREYFELSDAMRLHLKAFTSEDKPLYKLCQASSYAVTTLRELERHDRLQGPCVARALAITPDGLESLAAEYHVGNSSIDPRFTLMDNLGQAYRASRAAGAATEDELVEEIQRAFTQTLRRLPRALRKGLQGLAHAPKPGQDYSLVFQETIEDFANPMSVYPKAQALEWVEPNGELDAYLGGSAREALAQAMDQAAPADDALSLRDIHAAAVIAGLASAKVGEINVIGLVGNPGIGKTTAVVKHLSGHGSGYFFAYTSPRVVINREVTEKLARKKDGQPAGILAVTSNSEMIAAAARFHQRRVELGLDTPRAVDGAVMADGVGNLAKPHGSLLVLTPQEASQIEREVAGSRYGKIMLSESEDLLQAKPATGVMRAIAKAARELIRLNPAVRRMVLTCATQGLKDKGARGTTMDALSELFINRADSGPAAVAERQRFAEKMPTIVVMVDELAGDGAGALFVHGVAKWLRREFIDPFDERGSPFTVVLIVADASLSNEMVLDRYLSAGHRIPDKVLISKSHGKKPFALAATRTAIGDRKRQPVLHVMTNSYPARSLAIDYKINLTSARIQEKPNGSLETPREAIRRTVDEALLRSAAREIVAARMKGARQVIYFAQDKQFLRELQNWLADDPEASGWPGGEIQIIDQSVPSRQREKLLQEETRDRIAVFLMTSSGARGVSFPRADWIIASVPRFNVESSLMEIAQLIYRGRGMYHDEEGREVSGDDVPRHLVMLIDDYLVHDGPPDRRQWLRQSLDLMTLLVMLRSTLLTRITGDAGLRQDLALVPVGRIGFEEIASQMCQHVEDFLHESTTCVMDRHMAEYAGLLKAASMNCTKLFSRFRLRGTGREASGTKSFAEEGFARGYFKQASEPGVRLLPEGEALPEIPGYTFFSGPAVLENWAHLDKREEFQFEGHRTDIDAIASDLYGQLKTIDATQGCPSKLRIAAHNLLHIFAREKDQAGKSYTTINPLRSDNTWIALPATYPQFVHDGIHGESDEDAGYRCGAPDIWKLCLGLELSSHGTVMPPIPLYDGKPWAAAVGRTDPLKLGTVFDDRYFMASNELNLLNALLLMD
ncbi:Helicase conserved C-terminal domain-containing protein [Methylomagnum ishizawai]|uniref:Helicase conserved C-terminal domain-containing protein n=1 Tax=Methylomagnum ishizawai TaxID=1760988 RepID=A0A1Y6CUJ9_9GAMM|nr:helicase-related protein [Methylomagnum ishizawai]SMF94308.1 Helicase conserved C-terminal domain-containing protein [Methylomagnum ishizawai]